MAKVARQAEQMVHSYAEENEASVQEETQTNCMMRRCCKPYHHFVKLSCNNGFAQIYAKSFDESESTTEAHWHEEQDSQQQISETLIQRWQTQQSSLS